MNKSSYRLGIISALQQEQNGLIDLMQTPYVTERGMRRYIHGRLWDIECTCVISRIGKVAAAATVATLIEHFNVTHIIFTGVAGAAHTCLQVGDIVVADELIQHDMNASPLFPRFEIPLTNLTRFASDQLLTDRLLQAARNFIEQDFLEVTGAADRIAFNLSIPRIHHGLIASGDEFIDSSKKISVLKNVLPDLLAVEMEGAAVAQVCFEFGIPFAVIRTISDNANEKAPTDFMHFIEKIASCYAFNIMKRFCQQTVEDEL